MQTGRDNEHEPNCYYHIFALEYEDTVRWGEDYTLRAVWAMDMQHGGLTADPPVSYEVVIITNEGMASQQVISRSGFIQGPPIGIAHEQYPWGTGPAWADVAVVSPVQPE